MTAPASEMFSLQGRLALITGASRGIGLAMARGLGQWGARLIVTSRKADGLEKAAGELREDGLDVSTQVCNQGDPAAIDSLFAWLDAKSLSPDVVVVNAATNPVMGPLLATDRAAWQKILDVNLTGAFLTAQQSARRMIGRGGGSIIFIASIAGLDPLPSIPAYSVSKAGLIGLAKALAKELGPAGVRVNAIAPGLVETQFSSALFRDRAALERMIAQVPLHRHAQPDEIVGAAVYLASDASRYVTGQVLVVDGGTRM